MTTDWVRVRHHDTGHEYTVSRAEADMDKHLEILNDKDAVDVNGRPLPPKPRRHFNDGEGLKPLPAPDAKPVAPKTTAKPATTEGK